MAAENRDADAPLRLLSLGKSCSHSHPLAGDYGNNFANMHPMLTDGGGIRGIASLIILKHLMKQLKPTGPPLKPCEYFDLIGGTGAGG